jgi:UDP-4-amino-4,6-dideoxy-N-acetyl-beta-L-altrosamine transaminase
MKKISYGRQDITAEDIAAVVQVLCGEFLTQGPGVGVFESAFSETLGSMTDSKGAIYCAAVNSGTAGLHLACLALGLKAGDKVLVTPNTFVASANAVRYCGADLDFVDISPATLCMDLDLLEDKLSRSKGIYRGVIIVNFAGFLADMKRLRKIADAHGLWVLEDACHALGAQRFDAEPGDRAVYTAGDGLYSDISVFSFHPVKHVTTGEGGMITTASAQLYEKIKLLRTHGITKSKDSMSRYDGDWYYEMQELGFNYRIPDILSALGTSQLRRLDANLAHRRRVASRYDYEFSAGPIQTFRNDPLCRHAYHLYVIRTERRAELYRHLVASDIYPQVHYIPVHQQPYYQRLYGPVALPNCDSYYQQCLSLPMHHSLADMEQNRVIDAVNGFFGT